MPLYSILHHLYPPVAGAGAAAEAAVEVGPAAHRRREQLVVAAVEHEHVVAATAAACLVVALGRGLIGQGRHEHRLDAEVELAEDAPMAGLDPAHLLRDQGAPRVVQPMPVLPAAIREEQG